MALDDISLDIKDKKIYCLLGRNGAGKTTLLKSIAGHINVNVGTIEVDGQHVDTMKMPADVHFIKSGSSHFNAKIIDLINMARDLQDDFDYEFAKNMLTRFKLDKEKKYKQLSFGMQTMVTTLLSLASKAKIIILDEPVLGFDAFMREQFYDLLQESFDNNPRLIIVSTHLIDEIAKVAEDIIIIEKGKILLNTSVNDIDERAYSLTGITQDVAPFRNKLNVIGEKVVGGFISLFVFDNRVDPPKDVKLQPLGLQEFFISLVGRND